MMEIYRILKDEVFFNLAVAMSGIYQKSPDESLHSTLNSMPDKSKSTQIALLSEETLNSPAQI